VIQNHPARFATPRLVDALVFLLVFSGPPRLRVRDMNASLRAEIDAAILAQLIVWGVGFAWIVVRLYPVLVTRGLIPRFAAPQVIGAMMLVVLCAGIWIAPGPMLTAFSVYQLGIMLLFSWVFVQLYGPETYVRYLFWGYLLLAIAVFLAWLYMPELVVRRGRLRGDLIAPAGAMGAFGLMLCLSGLLRLKKPLFILAGGVFATVLVASHTRTAFAAFAACLLLGWTFRYSAPIKKALPIAVVALLLAALGDYLSVGQQYVVREQESVETMSDRTPLWDYLIGTMLRESPVVGLGYFSATRVLGPQYNPQLGNAHSAFVEVLVGGGIIGALLFTTLCLVMMGYSLRLFIHGRDDPLVFAVVALFGATFIISQTSTEGIHAGPVGFTFWSTAALLPAVWEQVRARRRTPRGDHLRGLAGEPPRPNSHDRALRSEVVS
jgi:O-antigen ligase